MTSPEPTPVAPYWTPLLLAFFGGAGLVVAISGRSVFGILIALGFTAASYLLQKRLT